MAKVTPPPKQALAPEEPSLVRNVVLLGHTQSGKTQLLEGLLAVSGRIPPLGIVDPNAKRERVTDTNPDEQDRGITYQTAVAATALKGADGRWTKINLYDTPGVGELYADAYGAMSVAGGGLLCVSALDGAKTVTRRAFGHARDRGMGLIVAVTKLDKDNADFAMACESVATLGRGVVPVNLAIGAGEGFRGIVNLLEMKAYYFADDGSGDERIEDIPADLVDAAQEARTVIEELAAETDEALMEQYFESGALDEESFVRGVRAGVRSGQIIPVLATSSTHNIGLRQVLNRIVEFLPHPGETPVKALRDGVEIEVASRVDAPAAAFVFRTAVDLYAGTISFMKMISGKLGAGDDVVVFGRGTERMAHLYTPMGVKLEEVDGVCAGDTFAVVKLKDTRTNDTLTAKGVNFSVAPVEFPRPSLSMALTAASRAHEDKLSGAIDKLLFEDPRLGLDRDVETHELVLMGAGQLHLELALARLKDRYGVEVNPHAPSIAYRETIKKPVDIHSRHKKQTGGHGQFADIKVKVEPLPSGSGIIFEELIVGGVVPKNYIPAVEKGFIDAAKVGQLARYPSVDFKVTLYDGGYHAVDSSDMAFQIAARQAFRMAWPQAQPTLLEPVMTVDVVVPDECTGDVMGDLSRRRGRVRGMQPDAGETTITAEVPMSELQTYANALKALTGDRGTFSMTFLGYEEVPHEVQVKIIEARKRDDD